MYNHLNEQNLVAQTGFEPGTKPACTLCTTDSDKSLRLFKADDDDHSTTLAHLK